MTAADRTTNWNGHQLTTTRTDRKRVCVNAAYDGQYSSRGSKERKTEIRRIFYYYHNYRSGDYDGFVQFFCYFFFFIRGKTLCFKFLIATRVSRKEEHRARERGGRTRARVPSQCDRHTRLVLKCMRVREYEINNYTRINWITILFGYLYLQHVIVDKKKLKKNSQFFFFFHRERL